MTREKLSFFFLNLGHLYDHLFVLLYATAVIGLERQFDLGYSELIALATPGFIAFGAFALPAGWLADRWSRPNMMIVFFLGIGASAILTGFAQTPLQIAVCLFLIGVFASIYHPVGIAMVVEGREKTGMALGINGVWGNMGVAGAALVAGGLIDLSGWRAAFVVPGAVAVVTGFCYAVFCQFERRAALNAPKVAKKAAVETRSYDRSVLIRIFVIVGLSTMLGSLIFQATTISLPKVFDERLTSMASTTTGIGILAAVVFSVAAFAQILVGWLIDRKSLRTVFCVIAGLQVPLYVVAVSLTGAPLFFVAMTFMLLVFGQIPINDALLARITKTEYRSRIFAVRFVLALGVSAVAVPFIAVMHSTVGFDGMFMTMCGIAALLFLAVLMLPRTGAVEAARPAPAE